MCDKPLSSKMFPSLLITEADEIREASRSFCGLPYPGDSASFNRPFLSLDKLVSQLPSLVPRWQVGSLHKPPHRMRGCLTRCSSIVLAERQVDRRERIKGGELPRIDLNQANMRHGACDHLGFVCPGAPGTLWFPAHAGGSRLSSFLPVLSDCRKTGNERPVR